MTDTTPTIVPLSVSGSALEPYRAAQKASDALAAMIRNRKVDRLDAQVCDAVITLTGGVSETYGELSEGDRYAYCYRDGRDGKHGRQCTPDGRMVSTWSDNLAAYMNAAAGVPVRLGLRQLQWIVAAAAYHLAGGAGSYRPAK